MEVVLCGILVVVVCCKRFLDGCGLSWAVAVDVTSWVVMGGWGWLLIWVLMGCCRRWFGRSGCQLVVVGISRVVLASSESFWMVCWWHTLLNYIAILNLT